MRKALLLPIALLALQACGGDNSNSSIDMTVIDSPDMPIPGDMAKGPVNKGTLILPSAQFVGLTADDYAVAYTGAKGGVSVAPLAGGTATVVDSGGLYVAISNKAVFSWSGVSTSNTVGALTVWSSGMTTPRMVTSMSTNGIASASADGTYIAYADNSVNGAATDIKVGKLDGTGATTTVVTNADSANTACAINVGNFGKGFFVSYCTGSSAMDMGTTIAHFTYIDPTATTPAGVAVAADATIFGGDTAGDKALYVDSAKNLYYTVVPPAGAATLVDTNVTSAFMKADGSAMVWTTTGGSLKHATMAAIGTPTVFSATGAEEILAISADESTAVVTDAAPDATTGLSKLATISLTAASAPVALTTAPTGVLYGPAFTADSKTVLWYDGSANNVATFHQTPLATGISATIADKVWNHNLASGTKIVMMDAYKAGSSATVTGTADLSLYDLASGTKTLIANGVQATNTIEVSKDKSKVAYDYQTKTAGQSGVYAASAQ